MKIRPFEDADEAEVVALWHACGLVRPWNDPRRDVERKRSVQRDLFLVAVLEGRIAASAMFGYDGHRGWVSYLGVSPQARSQGVGRALMREGERRLTALGCPKLNLQLRADNLQALGFYRALGYSEDAVVSLGKRLEDDTAP